ncbi:hypothetical protein MJ588_02185 [Klebsiella pneumoniae]|nr:hypothetical protein MJ588_02185 [Klebsiella pneumoniae]
MAAGARETLQRYAITFRLPSANPAINRSSLEKESRTVAQRLSVLPRHQCAGVLGQSGVQHPGAGPCAMKAISATLATPSREETLKVYRMLADLITSDVRLTIESVTQDDA